ncbi:MAG: copper resistance system multicopper oxidase [Verrucomicrobia bacterium]|nr:copper resistance system multicopper oxidase [Verrucomicrobiota bacterium]
MTHNLITRNTTRRRFLRSTVAIGLLTGLDRLLPAYALQPAGQHPVHIDHSTTKAIDLTVRESSLVVGDRQTSAVTVNGSVPGPLLRFREGQDVILRVNNALREDTSIHWHGLVLPADMDGVPGVSFAGIKPGETFTYRFAVKQNGTYWYHSHSGFQEQLGLFGPLIIDPAEPEPFSFDREHVVMLSDWTFENPHRILARLKKQSNFYNYQQRTVPGFFQDASKQGFRTALADRLQWGRMRMDPTDISDITGQTYTYLFNGRAPASNWTGLFMPGERVRLRFINAGAATYFDVRIPGLKMTVVQADGQYVQPVTVEEFRIANAETFDVIVEPKEDRAYTIFAEAMDRSGYARGTLATRQGMEAPIPPRRPRPLRTMADMGMENMEGMTGMDSASGTGGHSSHTPAKSDGMAGMKGMESNASQPAAHTGHGKTATAESSTAMPEMSMPAEAPHSQQGQAKATGEMAGMEMSGKPVKNFGPANSMSAMSPRSRVHEPGTGLEDAGHRVLVYADLRSLKPGPDQRPSEREIEMHLTGNMERYMWSFDGKKFSEASTPIPFKLGERVRLTFINDTMMSHPLHLHGMWMDLDTGAAPHNPRKHTISVQPGEKLSVDITADAPGMWAFHCHILYHMEVGMFRVVSVT